MNFVKLSILGICVVSLMCKQCSMDLLVLGAQSPSIKYSLNKLYSIYIDKCILSQA